jgi:hypothetical protein
MTSTDSTDLVKNAGPVRTIMAPYPEWYVLDLTCIAAMSAECERLTGLLIPNQHPRLVKADVLEASERYLHHWANNNNDNQGFLEFKCIG